jgi:hypothetical protein
MNRAAPPRAMPVTVAFEPTRLAEEALRGVYRALVWVPAKNPIRPLLLPPREAVRRQEGKRP